MGKERRPIVAVAAVVGMLKPGARRESPASAPRRPAPAYMAAPLPESVTRREQGRATATVSPRQPPHGAAPPTQPPVVATPPE